MKTTTFLLPAVLLLLALPLVTPHDDATKQDEQQYSPLLIVPGLTGSQLYFKYTSAPKNPKDIFCSFWARVKYHLLWIDPAKLLFCSDKLQLSWKEGKGFSNHPDVDIKALDLDDPKALSSVEHLGSGAGSIDSLRKFTKYFEDNGFKRNKEIRAAPYDWRLAADELQKRDYFAEFKKLVEKMYKDNNRRVTIVCFSMGCPVSHHFLTRTGLTQAWKDQYIHGYVTVVGGWAGGVVALQALISGVGGKGQSWPYNVPAVSKLLTNIGRSMESLFWLMPRPPIWGQETIVSTPNHKYSAHDYEKLFHDLPGDKFGNAYKKFQQAISLGADFPAPNVSTYCIYSRGNERDTPERLEYSKDFENEDPTGEAPNIILGWGDRTVNEKNAKICLQWKDMPQGFQSRECKGFSHRQGCGDATVHIVEKFAKIKPPSDNENMDKLLEMAVKESLIEALEEKIAAKNRFEEIENLLMQSME